MKKLNFLAVFLFFTVLLFAQEENDTLPLPIHEDVLNNSEISVRASIPFAKDGWDIKTWGYCQLPSHVVLNVQAGKFGLPNTLDVGALYNPFKKKQDVWVAPGCGMIVGEYFGLTPQVLMRLERNRFSILSHTKYIVEFVSNNPEALYNFTQIGYAIPKTRLEFGIVSELNVVFFTSEEIFFGKVTAEYEGGVFLKYSFARGAYVSLEYMLKQSSEEIYNSVADASCLTFVFGWKSAPYK